jgi:GDP-D-mannose dehydratase
MTRRALITGISGQDGSYLADDLCADPRRARYELGWKPEVDFPALVRMMVQADLSAQALTPRIGSRQVGNQAAIREVVG